MRRVLPLVFALFASSLALPACTTLQQMAALKDVKFDLDGVAQPFLAGVDLQRVRGYNDLRPTDLLRLTNAISSRKLSLTFTLLVGAENPADNPVTARMLQLDWTLFLEDRETISGVLINDTGLGYTYNGGGIRDCHLRRPIPPDHLRFMRHEGSES